MPVLVSSPSCDTVLRHLVECTGAKPLRLELERQGSLAARGDGTARAPYAGGAPRRCQKSASPQVTSRRPCHSAPHIFWRPTIPIPRGRPLICIKERQSPQAPYPAAMPFTSRRFSGPHASGRPPYPGAAHARQQSPHVPTPQCGSSHTFAPFPHTIRRLPHLSIPWRNSPYKCQIPHRASKLHKIPHRTRRDRRGIAVGLRRRPPYASVALRQFTKNCKVRNPTSRKPHTAAHASQILMHLGFPYGPCSHTFPRLPHTATKLQKSQHWFRRDQHFRLRKFSAFPTSAVPHVQTEHQPAENSDRFTQIYASNQSPHLPCNKGGRLWQCAGRCTACATTPPPA